VLIFKEMANNTNFQLMTFSYAQFLKKLGASDISAITKNEYQLAYPLQKSTDVKFIEFSFDVSPQALKTFTQRLRLDELLLRFFLTKKA
jgi:ribosomal protein S6